jgi:hypothetical protein
MERYEVIPNPEKLEGPSEFALGLFIHFALEKYRMIGYVCEIQGFQNP